MTTVAISKQPRLSVEDVFITHMKSYEDNFQKLLSENGISTARFVQTTINTIKRTPKLLECDTQTLFGAIFTAAELGLSVSDHAGECYIIPYGKQAQFQMAYKGFVELFYRSGVQSIWSSVVRENDDFTYQLGTNPNLIHRPANTSRGEEIGAYACAKVNGETTFVYMNRDEIQAIKNMSPAAKRPQSPWNMNDPQKWMWQKTCIKQLAKTLPKSGSSGSLAKAIQADNVAEMGGRILLEEETKQVVLEDSFSAEKTPEQKQAEVAEKKEEMKANNTAATNPEML